MSYRALGKLREQMEIETLKSMTFEQINGVLNKFKLDEEQLHAEIDDLQKELMVAGAKILTTEQARKGLETDLKDAHKQIRDLNSARDLGHRGPW